MTRRGFAFGGAAILAGLAGRHWIFRTKDEGGLIWPLRRALELDEAIGRAAFRPSRPSPTFPASAARMPRINGTIGLGGAPDVDRFTLRVLGPGGERSFSMAEIRALPRAEVTTELRCIEGWSTVVRWGGARLADLAAVSGLATRSGRRPDLEANHGDLLPFVAMSTPTSDYYVGLDIASALHPQTLLCHEMGGHPLEPGHGAPLRLAIPVKYGIKSIKNLATIRFASDRPPDYWAESGYDWYAGH